MRVPRRLLIPISLRSFSRSPGSVFKTGTLAVAGAGHRYSFIPVDAVIYADLAKTWINQHVYGFGDVVSNPSLIRLPGYPVFVATLFAFFGQDHFTPIYVTQLIADIGTCFVSAWLAMELFADNAEFAKRAGQVTFAIAALCPFTAQYVALALTETLAIFCAATACLFFVRAVRAIDQPGSVREVVLCGLATAYGILLRPDGGILLVAFVAYLLWHAVRRKRAQLFRMATLLVCVALLPLIPWTVRNWRTFHVFQPLVPRYATAPGEYVPYGFNRWTKTWMADYVSVEEVFWKVSSEGGGEAVDVDQLPARAFDSAEERNEVSSLFDDLTDSQVLTPEMDAQFGEIARRRVRAHPLRYYVMLPAMRIANMWFRPRTETIPIDTRWWEFGDTTESVFAMSYAALDITLVLLGWPASW